ncbi:helix-turn-helix transcriptional regulator [Vibrio sp. Isolate25]|uniref:AraC family transcriptional regulator n=1 Tax=Vibrio TaxID=662 RepID=UPI001EFC53B0|nr:MULTISPECIES: helix-turn-helix transcriptional regulator [Vibrio]MCG9596340.1 helix-turn-helix transcriptional regulator [Vibrio sp. Isolate25]MCG9680142.1 helix-turn-helix transcriptional regulator [Vibrio sp. Isolate24]
MNISKEMPNCDYSEWQNGAALIAKEWQHERSDFNQLEQRPHNWHKHYRGQLLCIDEGLIQVKTDEGTWILPPHRAGWIPPNAMHSVYFCGSLKGRSLLFTPEVCGQFPIRPCVIEMSDVLKVLSIRVSTWSKTEDLSSKCTRILSVISDEVGNSPHESLYFPLPKDPRLQKITQAILIDPNSKHSIEYWASIGAVSSRTLRRLIRSELNISFSEWRQQILLIHSLEMMARGVSVGEVAYALGYSTPSNFIAMFRRVYGESPTRYFSNRSI